MKQLLLNYRTGDLTIEDVPAPALDPGGVVVQNHYSLVSAGTERATLGFARRSLLGKARSRPDLVKRVIQKARTDGILTSYRSAMARLDDFEPLGYSSAGRVIEAGVECGGFAPGDLVACAGRGYASHAEIVYAPRNLVAALPSGVSARQGAFATMGAIAMQGIRRAELTPGERVAVIGLGLVGQLTVQILNAYGFPVLGLDVSRAQVEAARKWEAAALGLIGEDDPESIAAGFSDGAGVDAVIITAASESSEPVELAGRILRERGRVSAVGDVGMTVPRRLYYAKELDFRVSKSYGPGRDHPAYEDHGLDYPSSYVRWTEERNMGEFLRLLSTGRVDVEAMVTDVFPIERALDAYELVSGGSTERVFSGVLIEYEKTERAPVRRTDLTPAVAPARQASGGIGIGLAGAGNFAKAQILPAFKSLSGVSLRGVATRSGASASSTAGKFGFAYATTDFQELLDDPAIGLIVIATRHDSHAEFTSRALRAGKHVHVEKPLALTRQELRTVAEAAVESPGELMVGFNRRFAPHAVAARSHFANRSVPLMMQYRINAGFLPPDRWEHDPSFGGGRILGEVCHFVDLLHFFAGSPPVSVFATRLPAAGDRVLPDDNVLVTLEFTDGSRGTIAYSALGAERMPKEWLEIMGDGKSVSIDNFRKLDLYDGTGHSSRKGGQDKGHDAQFQAFAKQLIAGEASPVPLDELLLSSLATLCIQESLGTGTAVKIDLASVIGAPEDAGSPADAPGE